MPSAPAAQDAAPLRDAPSPCTLKSARRERRKTDLQRQMDATDQQIDRLGYELYGLTEEEIRIVEGTTQ